MGFLKKDKVPDELPDLAIEEPSKTNQKSNNLPISSDSPISQRPISNSSNPQKEVAGEHFLEFPNVPSNIEKEVPKSPIDTSKFNIPEGDSDSFFDKILEDINGEIKDLNKLEDWYKNKFLPQDVVSNMRSYWEDNKADMIIRNFGSEYRQKINEKIKRLQELEEDWREIYFKLIKKEEEMKGEEKDLKETLSEFVDICKRRGKINDEEKKEEKPEEENKN